MYAWGQLLTFSAVCGPMALFPSGLAIYFLGRSEKLRRLMSFVSLPLAFTGLASFILSALGMARGVESEAASPLLGNLVMLRHANIPCTHAVPGVFCLHVLFSPPSLPQTAHGRRRNQGPGGCLLLLLHRTALHVGFFMRHSPSRKRVKKIV